MKLSPSREYQTQIFEERLEEIKNTEDDELSLFDTRIIKSLYINKILTSFSLSYENDSYILMIDINIPKILYDTQEYFDICVYNKSFPSKTELINAFYAFSVPDIQCLSESKLNKHFVYHHELCSVFGCENVYNSNCPQCGYFLCLPCLLNLNLQNSVDCCGCRFKFKK